VHEVLSKLAAHIGTSVRERCKNENSEPCLLLGQIPACFNSDKSKSVNHR